MNLSSRFRERLLSRVPSTDQKGSTPGVKRFPLVHRWARLALRIGEWS
jgi:hypothetical protein